MKSPFGQIPIWGKALLLSAWVALPLTTAGETESPSQPVYLLPSTDAIQLGNTSPDEMEILPEEAVPLEEDLWEAGWRAITYALDTTEAYVRAHHIGKDFSVDLEAAIFIEPDDSIEYMITIVEEADEIEVLEMEKNWGRLHLRKPLQAFVLTEGERETEAEETPDEEESPSLLDEADSLEIVDVERPSPTRTRPTDRPRTGRPDLDEGFEANMRTYKGVLGRTRRILGRGPSEPYSLYDQRGRRIAVLQTERLLLTTSMDRLIGRPVTIHGVLRMSDEGNYSVIIVDSLRAR